MTTGTGSDARRAAAETFNATRDEMLTLLDEFGRNHGTFTAPGSTDDDRAVARAALVEMTEDLEGAYLFYKHQCEHRSMLGRNPHSDTELGELKHEKGRAHKAWQACIALAPLPPTPEQVKAAADAEALRVKAEKDERRAAKLAAREAEKAAAAPVAPPATPPDSENAFGEQPRRRR